MKTFAIILSVFGFCFSSVSAELLSTWRAKRERVVTTATNVTAAVLPSTSTNVVNVTNVVTVVVTNLPPKSSKSVYRDSRSEVHRVVLLYNSRGEVDGTNYITEVRDHRTGKDSYRSVKVVAPPSPPPVVVVECRAHHQSCCQPCGWTGNGYSWGGGGCDSYASDSWAGGRFSGNSYGGQYYSGGVYEKNYRSGESWSTSGYGKQSFSSSGFVAGGGFSANVYPRNTGYVVERNYSYGGGVSVGGGFVSGLNHNGGSFSGSYGSGSR